MKNNQLIKDITTNFNLRDDLLRIEVGDNIEVSTKWFDKENDTEKFKINIFRGIVTAVKRKKSFSSMFTVVKESSRVIIKKRFFLNSPLIIGIKKLENSIRLEELNFTIMKGNLVKKRGEVKSKFKVPFNPRKDLGQNFLFNEYYLSKISNSFSSNCEKNVVVEVGPGYGNLTFFLQKKFKRIYCIEKDEKLFELLKDKFCKHPNVEFLLADIIGFDLSIFIKNDNSFALNIIGNLPYGISNKLIFEIVKQRNLIKEMVFLIQKEVAKKWTSTPNLNKKLYSFSSVFIDYFFEKSLKFEIPRKEFYPIPKVDGAVVNLKFREKFFFSCKENEKKFLLFIKNCFRFRRKTLFNNIKSFLGNKEDDIINAFKYLKYDYRIRPQELWIQNYFELYNKIF